MCDASHACMRVYVCVTPLLCLYVRMCVYMDVCVFVQINAEHDQLSTRVSGGGGDRHGLRTGR